MPNIRSAKKKMRQDVKRTKNNHVYERAVQDIMKKVTTADKSDSLISKAYSVIDKAVKKRIIHKHKAARLKSRVGRKAKVTK